MARAIPAPVWAFADETGDVGSAPSSSRYLIVAVILTRCPRSLRRATVQTRKHLRKKLKNIPELKAKRAPLEVTARFLRYIAKLDVEIVAIILDKRSIWVGPDTEDRYRLVCAEAIRHCFERHSWLKLILDRRYTNIALREKLEEAIMNRAFSTLGEGERRIISIEHSDSATEKGIQAADAVAWSLGQKYERCEDELYRIIQDKIIVEEILQEK